MKKISIFLMMFLGVFGLALNDVQAETKVFQYYPEPEKTIGEDLFGTIKKVLFLGQNAVAETIYQREDKSKHSVADGGGSATDEFFGFYSPTENRANSKHEIEMMQIPCSPLAQNTGSSLFGVLPNFLKTYLVEPALALSEHCYKPKPYIPYHPYYISQATLVTDATDNIPSNADQGKCQLNIAITNEDFCDSEDPKITHGSSGHQPCRVGQGIVAFLDGKYLNEREQNVIACAHVRLDAGGLFSKAIKWWGHIEIVAKRGSLDRFAITGIDAKTGKSKTVSGNQTLQICRGEAITIDWRTSDGVEEIELLGKDSGSWMPLGNVNGPNTFHELENRIKKKGTDACLQAK